MAFETIPMNLGALENISNFNVSVTTTDIIGDIVRTSNSATGDYLIFASLSIIFMILYWVLTDVSEFQDFGYDYIRGLNISLSVCILIGLVLVEIGFSNNFYAVGLFTTLWFLSYIGILIIDNRE